MTPVDMNVRLSRDTEVCRLVEKKSVKNLIKKHYLIKMPDICNKNPVKVHLYNSRHLPVSWCLTVASRDQFCPQMIGVQNVISGFEHGSKLSTV